MTSLTTPAEIRSAFLSFKKEIGPKAYVGVSVSLDLGAECSCSIYPDGIGSGSCMYLHASGSTWDELLVNARDKWAVNADLHAANLIEAMSKAIIEITYRFDECTDAHLRAEFDAADVAKYGAAAVERANAMAEKGPFSIALTEGANERAAA